MPMVTKPYPWREGAELLPHSAKKLQIIRDYFSDYLRVRCQHPQQALFRLAIVDGFAGAGKYSKGESGSPLVFIETLEGITSELNVYRASQGMKPLRVECTLVLNDADKDASALLKVNAAAAIEMARSTNPMLKISATYLCADFDDAYPDIKKLLVAERHQNVIFNIDPCGNSLVRRALIDDALRTFKGSEVFLTFMIQSLLTFLQKANPVALAKQLQFLSIDSDRLDDLDGKLLSRSDWLGAAEKMVFDTFLGTAAFVSPFSIHNPDGWRYWLIHFAHAPRARQVYNDVLHQNKSSQAHFGRSGLNMLSYSPDDEGRLYLFDDAGRSDARQQLMSDIPRYVAAHGDTVTISEFQFGIYNHTPAHSRDIHQAIFDNPDLEVLTPQGGERRKAHTISSDDVLRLKRQPSFHSLWGLTKKP